MKCYTHNDIDAIGTCTNCGKAICKDCAVEVNNKLTCKSCYNNKSVPINQEQKEKKRNPLFLIAGIFFLMLIPVNLLLSLIFPPIFLQFVICMIPMGILAAVFLGAYILRK